MIELNPSCTELGPAQPKHVLCFCCHEEYMTVKLRNMICFYSNLCKKKNILFLNFSGSKSSFLMFIAWRVPGFFIGEGRVMWRCWMIAQNVDLFALNLGWLGGGAMALCPPPFGTALVYSWFLERLIMFWRILTHYSWETQPWTKLQIWFMLSYKSNSTLNLYNSWRV